MKATAIETPAEETAVPEMPVAGGGATIADRFKLDMPDQSAKPKKSGGIAATIAVIAAVLALVASGVLTFIIYQHWEFLMPA